MKSQIALNNSRDTEEFFKPFQLGTVLLGHRVVMAPLTRLRSTQPGDTPNQLMMTYYGQRASVGGLIISEATTVVITGRGYLGAPGIYSDAQVAGWRNVIKTVHAKGGKMFLQLWHVGRVAHVEMTGGQTPVGVRIGPSNTFNEMFDSNPEATFGFVARELNRFSTVYLHIIEPRIKGNEEVADGRAPEAAEQLRRMFKGPIIAAGGFDPMSANKILRDGEADLVAFGRFFISNPDLPKRIRLGCRSIATIVLRSTVAMNTAMSIIRSQKPIMSNPWKSKNTE